MMSQTSIDYLFQVTAPLPERLAAGTAARGSVRPWFGDHLAQASGPAISSAHGNPDVRDEPAISESSAADRRPVNAPPVQAPAANADSLYSESGASAAPSPSVPCGEAEPDSAAEETTVGQAAIIEPVGETSQDAEQSEATEERAEEADEYIAHSTDAAAADAEDAGPVLTTGTAALDGQLGVATIATESDAIESTASTSERHDADGLKPTQAAATSTVDPLAKADEADEATKLAHNQETAERTTRITPSVSFEVPVVADKLVNDSSTAQTAAPRDGNDSRKSSAAARDAANTNHQLAQVNDAAMPATQSKPTTEKTAVVNRRRNVTSDAADESRRRTKESRESHSAQRTDATAIANKAVGSAVANAHQVDSANTTAVSNSGDESTRKTASATATRNDALLHPLGRSHRAQGQATRGSADHTPRIDATRFVGRVAKAIQTANERGGALQLRLRPPELGSLRLELTVQNGVMAATLEAESQVARQVLLDHLPALRDRLAEQHIRIERFDVEVRQDGSSGQTDARASQHEQHQQQQFQNSASQRNTSREQNPQDSQRVVAAVPLRINNNEINVLA